MYHNILTKVPFTALTYIIAKYWHYNLWFVFFQPNLWRTTKIIFYIQLVFKSRLESLLGYDGSSTIILFSYLKTSQPCSHFKSNWHPSIKLDNNNNYSQSFYDDVQEIFNHLWWSVSDIYQNLLNGFSLENNRRLNRRTHTYSHMHFVFWLLKNMH